MKHTTAENLLAASYAADKAVQALREALHGSTALQGDCIADLLRAAAELKRKTARLADVIEQDAK